MDADKLAEAAYSSAELKQELRSIVRDVMGATSYRSLTDAAEVTGDDRYFGRSVEIWYANAKVRRDMTGGYQYLRKFFPELIPTNLAELKETHVLVGKIDVSTADDAWMLMQGDKWSPNGEGRGMIKGRGLHHTSMSVGDVVILRGVMHMVDNVGFKKLN